MEEALKEILRIVQTNGGLYEGDKIDITYCSGLWRIEELARVALCHIDDTEACTCFHTEKDIEDQHDR